MKILVTGGAGFIGSNLAEALSKEHRVIALDNLYLGKSENLNKEIEFVKGSVMDEELLGKTSKDCDFIFHDAALSSSPMFKEDPRNGIEVNVIGFMNVMKAALSNGVRKVIYASSSSLYSGNPLPFSENQKITAKTFYEASFHSREILAQTYYYENNLSSIGLRYFSVYGPKESHKSRYANNISQFLWDMMQGRSPVIYGDGMQSRDFTFINDILSANILATTSNIDFGIFNVGTGIGKSFNDIVSLINSEMGASIESKYIQNPLKNYVQDTLADISLITASLGYSPQWTVEKGIKFLLEYYRENS